MNNAEIKSLSKCIAREWDKDIPNKMLIMALLHGLNLGLKSRNLQ